MISNGLPVSSLLQNPCLNNKSGFQIVEGPNWLFDGQSIKVLNLSADIPLHRVGHFKFQAKCNISFFTRRNLFWRNLILVWKKKSGRSCHWKRQGFCDVCGTCFISTDNNDISAWNLMRLKLYTGRIFPETHETRALCVYLANHFCCFSF